MDGTVSAECLLCLAFAGSGRDHEPSKESGVEERGEVLYGGPSGVGHVGQGYCWCWTNGPALSQVTLDPSRPERGSVVSCGVVSVLPVVLAEVTQDAKGGSGQHLSSSPSFCKEGRWGWSSPCLGTVFKLAQRLGVAVLCQAVYDLDPFLLKKKTEWELLRGKGECAWWAHACVLWESDVCDESAQKVGRLSQLKTVGLKVTDTR